MSNMCLLGYGFINKSRALYFNQAAKTPDTDTKIQRPSLARAVDCGGYVYE